MVYLFAKTSKTFQTHFPLAATHQAPPLSRALIGWPARLAQISPCVFTSFSFAARTLKTPACSRRAVSYVGPLSGRRARAGPTGVCRVLGPWRTLDAPESPRVGCNCGLVALELARFQCRLDSKYLESTSHLIQCVSRSESLSTAKPTAITYQILPKQLTTARASAPPGLLARQARVVESLEQQSDIKNYFDIVQHKQECLIQTREPFQPIRPKRGS